MSFPPCQLSSRFVDSTDRHIRTSQYIGKFKQWHIKKNLTNEEWKFIDRKLRKRKQEGKESDIYFHGKLIPDKKVKKETSRHAPPTFQQPQFSGKKQPKLCIVNQYTDVLKSSQPRTTGRNHDLYSTRSNPCTFSLSRNSLVRVSGLLYVEFLRNLRQYIFGLTECS